MDDEEFIEEISNFVGDLAYALYRLFAQDSRGGSVHHEESDVKHTFEDLTRRFIKLIND